jgi:Flp pilus assembly protein protease CpaA
MDFNWVKFINSFSGKVQLNLLAPFLLSVWMAWIDIKSLRIPNYLTFGGALAGLLYQLGYHGWVGLWHGFWGMILGFALLILFYVKGGVGAADVKALAALGAWLGPWQTLLLFIYMAFSGLLLIIFLYWWKGLLWCKICQAWQYLVNWVLLQRYPSMPQHNAPLEPKLTASSAPKLKDIPYAVAIALGMAILCGQSFKI